MANSHNPKWSAHYEGPAELIVDGATMGNVEVDVRGRIQFADGAPLDPDAVIEIRLPTDALMTVAPVVHQFWKGDTVEERSAYAELHIGYEVRKMLEQRDALLKLAPGGDTPITDALLEACLVHLRSLDDFVGKDDRFHPTDVVAWTYLPEWTPSRFLAGQRQPLNQQLPHLSSERVEVRWWDVPQLARSCCVALSEFLTTLQTHHPEESEGFVAIDALVRAELASPRLTAPGMTTGSTLMSTTASGPLDDSSA